MTKFVLSLVMLGSLAAGVPTTQALTGVERPTPSATATPAAAAADFTVTVSTKEKGPAMTVFGASEPMVVANFKGGSVAKGDKLRVSWVVESSKGMSTPNKVVFEHPEEAKGPNTFGSSTLNRPASGWPLGKYHVDVYLNNAKAASVKFTIK